ncbi:uncharacterized protein [Argopecten irradians]|uniref:uncharacterized protein n=1 Tax=Argopecten irradians TaxID=31199 RepID=UPI0037197ABD
MLSKRGCTRLISFLITFICTRINGQQLDNLRGPWRLVFKVHRSDYMTGYASAAEFLTTPGGSSETDVSVMTDLYSTGIKYRSTILDDWGTTRTISAVRLAVWDNDVEMAYFTFNTMGKSLSNWMDCNNIIDSSYTDIFSESIETCQVSNSGRNFIIQRGYGGCDQDNGWLVVKDTDATGGCSWDYAYSYVTILFAPGSTYTTWQDSLSYADAVTLSVMEWHMVFKGIEGVTPSAGSLQSSWEGDTVENDDVSAVKTLTTSPSSHFKDGLAEIWTEDFTLIEQVKYAFFNDGQETAYVVFNAMDSTKTSFFSAANIIASNYSDLTTSSPLYCSITGDTVRQFAVTDVHGGCTADYHWMLVMDVGATSKPCGFDQDVTTRPYFLYSNGTTSVVPDSAASTWNSAEFPSANVMGLFVKGWFPVMKVAYGQSTSPASSIYYLWISSYSSYNINEFDSRAYSFSAGTPSYRSRIVQNWTSYYISAVRISMIKNGVEVAFFVFDAHASSRTDWMSCSDRLLYSSYSDINRGSTHNYCSVSGSSTYGRRFFIESSYGGCDGDIGWIVVAESGGTCDWETSYTYPYALYSDAGNTMEVNSGMALADVFVVSVAFEDFCSLTPCQNGATCYERGVRFECVCAGDYYGIVCDNRDANWQEWGAWSSCSVTCHNQGTRTRTRSCDGTSAGSGSTCSGSSSESEVCDPDSEVCPLYSSGTLTKGNSYTMTCPATFDIYTQSAYYGRSSSYSDCQDTSALSRVMSACDGSVSCTVTFSDSLFSGYTSSNCDDCILSSSCTSSYISGYATFKCGRDGGVSTWQPWSLCSVTCGGGTRTRSRTCDNPLPIDPGTGCSETLDDSKDCFTNACPTCGEHASGYRDFQPANMTSYNDSSTGVAFLLTNTWWEIICCEVLEAIEFMPLHEGTITFIVWRSSGGSYTVVSTASYAVTAEEANGTMAVNYTFPLGERMNTHTGDNVGWYTSGPNMIPFITCTGEEACPNATKKAPFASEPAAGDSFAWGSHGSVETLTDRAYAIKFYTNQNTAPYVNQTEFSAFVKDHEPIGTHAIDYSIYTDEIGDPLTHSISHPQDFFELNATYDPTRLFLQVKRKLPKDYNVYTIQLTSRDTCSISTTTTYTITTYNAPPVYLNLPTELTLAEDVSDQRLIWQIDVYDPSDNDSICCTLAKVEPASFNFEMIFTNDSYNIFLTASVAFDYKEISDFYKLRVCCSDETGTSMSFIDIDITNVVAETAYVPPTWFFLALVCSLIPIMITFVIACFVLFFTMFCNPELNYIIVYDD